METKADRIRELRAKDKSLSQIAIAKIIGTNQSYVSAILNGLKYNEYQKNYKKSQHIGICRVCRKEEVLALCTIGWVCIGCEGEYKLHRNLLTFTSSGSGRRLAFPSNQGRPGNHLPTANQLIQNHKLIKKKERV